MHAVAMVGDDVICVSSCCLGMLTLDQGASRTSACEPHTQTMMMIIVPNSSEGHTVAVVV